MDNSDYKYWAFISYSHQDSAWATWLHKRLERYRVPRRLVGRPTALGKTPRHLHPIFRDRDELPSSSELGTVINEALRTSRYQVVICSPRSASSKWVNEEIKHFKSLGREDRVLALIVDGEPGASRGQGSASLECFPRALRFHVSGEGAITAEPSEPIAADARRGKDGKESALLKIVAGLLDVGFDELRQRERRRVVWRRIGTAAASFVVIATILAVGFVADQRVRREHAQRDHVRYLADLVEAGRVQLNDDNPMRAAVFLAEAYRLGETGNAMRFMLGQAMQPVDAARKVFDDAVEPDRRDAQRLSNLRFSRDSKRLAASSRWQSTFVWEVDTGKLLLKTPELRSKDALGVSLFIYPSLSADGKLMLLRLYDGTTQITQVWDIDRQQQLVQQSGTTNDGNPALQPFDPADRHLAKIDNAGRAALLDLATGHEELLTALPKAVTSFGYSPDGRRLLAGAADGTVTVIDASSLRVLKILQGPVESVWLMAVSVDGNRIAAGYDSGALRVWNASSGQILLASGHESEIVRLRFNADGHRLESASARTVRVWNVDNGALLLSRRSMDETGGFDSQTALSADGDLLSVVNANGALDVVDVASDRVLYRFEGDREGVIAASASPDDRYVAFTGDSGRVFVNDRHFRPLATIRHQQKFAHDVISGANWVAFDPTSTRFITAGSDGHIKLYDVTDRKLDHEFIASDSINNGRFGRAAPFAITALFGGEAARWNLDSGERQWQSPIGEHNDEKIAGIYLSADERRVMGRNGSAYSVLDSGTGERLYQIDAASLGLAALKAAGMAPDGQHIFACGVGEMQMRVLGEPQPRWRRPVVAGSDPECPWDFALAFSPDSSRLVFGTRDGLQLLDTATGTLLATPPGEKIAGALRIKFSANGRQVLFGSVDGTGYVWTPETNEMAVSKDRWAGLRNGFGPAPGLAWGADFDRSAAVWDTVTGKTLATVAGHGAALLDASISPDGQWMLTGASDDLARLWDLRPELRTPEMLGELLACRVPWRVSGLTLEPRDIRPESCQPR